MCLLLCAGYLEGCLRSCHEWLVLWGEILSFESWNLCPGRWGKEGRLWVFGVRSHSSSPSPAFPPTPSSVSNMHR